MDLKEDIKERLAIEDVVGDYMELKRAGRNFKALSPFTSERTPSFMVSPDKQIWHDFSSNKGGDIFSFIMEVEGVDFKEALEILARKANLDISQYRTSSSGSSAKLKKRLLEAHKVAAQYYHICLSKNQPALKYIKEDRHFTPETIRTWQLGYSPEDGKALLTALTKRGFSTTELQKAGLITQRRDGWGDMFRGRIMVPLSDGQGNVVGFTARLLKDNPQAPKYFNTPQTLIYDKGRQVFGLHHAKDQIRKKDFVVVVEGNLDVIASHQAGKTNVVATAGTAMTIDHLRYLSRLTPNIRLAFDSDEAGINATERAIGLGGQLGINVGVVTMPAEVKDPDKLIQKDPLLWGRAIGMVQDAVEWVLDRYDQLHDKSTATGKRLLSNKALALIKNITDPVEREHYLKVVSRYLEVSETALIIKLQQQAKAKVRKKPLHAQPVEPDKAAYEDDFLALNAFFPEVRESLSVASDSILQNEVRETVKEALISLPSHERLSPEKANLLHLDENYVKILQLTVEEKYAGFNPADIMAEAMALARRIKSESKKTSKTNLTAAIAKAEAEGNHSEAAKLLKDYQELLKKER